MLTEEQRIEIDQYIHVQHDDFARRLSKIINKSNKTPEQLDHLCGFKSGMTRNLMIGNEWPNRISVDRLSEALDVELNW